jgi:predicted DNA-binding protein (MmcQ/YjbR family)
MSGSAGTKTSAGRRQRLAGQVNRPTGKNGRVRASEAAEAIRALALSLPETYEDEPWGHPVFKVAENRMFGSMSVEDDCVRLTVKLTAEEREIAYLLPYVSRARYVGRYGWVTAEVRDEESLASALEWLRESYWLKAPSELKAAVEEH